MRFALPFATLSKILSRAAKVRKNRQCHGMAPLVRLTVDRSVLTAEATDGREFWYSETVAVDGAAYGSILVDEATLAKVLRGGKAADLVTVEHVPGDGVGAVLVTVGDLPAMRTGLPTRGLDPESAPAPAPATDLVALMASADLIRGCDVVLPSVSRDEGRPNLTGAEFKVDPAGTLRVAATDGHRLTIWTCPVEGDLARIGIVPRFLLEAVAGLKGDGEAAQIGRKGAHVSATVGGVTYTARAIDGTFPDFSAVMPVEREDRRMFVKRDLLLGALKRAAGLVNTKTNNVVLDPSAGDGLAVSWRDADLVDFGLDLPLLRQPDRAVRAGYNVDYLIDAVGSFGAGSELSLEIVDSLSPTVLRSAADPGVYQLVMPMRI